MHPDFKRDVGAQVEYLRAQEDVERIHGLLKDLTALKALLEDYPEAGREVMREGDASLRMMPLRRASFVAWYKTAAQQGEVTLYRLFHERQRRPKPELP